MQAVQIALAAIVLMGCRHNSLGTCHITFLDPLITIDRVQNATTGADLSLVKVSSILFDNRSVPDLSLLVSGPAHGVTIEGGILHCNVACGFGTEEGAFTMTVGAVGFRDTTVSLSPRYDGRVGNCPATFSRGDTLRLQLSPA